MDYKEKYEMALEGIQEILGSGEDSIKMSRLQLRLQGIFPELKESEDELTWLTKYIEEEAYSLSMDIRDDEDRIKLKNLQRSLAWLKRQGEQKPADKVEPKFHVGDFITDGKRIFQIEETIWERNNRNDGTTYCESLIVNLKDGNTYANNTDLKEYHLWTIQDAKDGDVLHSPTNRLIWIYKDNGHYHASINLNYADVVLFDNEIVVPSDVCPANRVQKSILFQKMEEAGYEWSDKDRKLIKIDPCETCNLQTLNCQSFPCSRKKQGNHPTDNEMKELLRMEYEKGRADAIAEMKWSEEDEKMMGLLIDIFKVNYPNEVYKANPINTTNMKGIRSSEIIDWLKSIRPQNKWKPSEKQLEVLSRLNTTGCLTEQHDCDVLVSLYNDLQKL